MSSRNNRAITGMTVPTTATQKTSRAVPEKNRPDGYASRMNAANRFVSQAKANAAEVTAGIGTRTNTGMNDVIPVTRMAGPIRLSGRRSQAIVPATMYDKPTSSRPAISIHWTLAPASTPKAKAATASPNRPDARATRSVARRRPRASPPARRLKPSAIEASYIASSRGKATQIDMFRLFIALSAWPMVGTLERRCVRHTRPPPAGVLRMSALR